MANEFDAALADRILQEIAANETIVSARIADNLGRAIPEIEDTMKLVHVLRGELFIMKRNNSNLTVAVTSELELERINNFLSDGGFVALAAEQAVRTARQDAAHSRARAEAEADKAADREKRDLEVAALRRQAKESRYALWVSIGAGVIALLALIAQLIQIATGS